MLAVSRDTLPSIYSSPEIQVPGADPPYLPGAGAIPFRVSKSASLYPP